MKSTYRNLIILLVSLLLPLAMPLTAAAKGKPIRALPYRPNFAEQGDKGEPVVLTGRNFPDRAKITFIFNLDGDPGDGDVQQVTTTETFVDLDQATGNYAFDIDVKEEAFLGDYDIEVEEVISEMLTGRKGKGTTLFAVEARGNRVEVDCSGFASGGTCTCRFEVDLDTDIHSLLGDCQTSETLWLTAQVKNADPGQPMQITAKNCDSSELPVACAGKDGTFDGTTVFANDAHVAMVRNINIGFGDLARGCDAGEVRSAISFVLHDGINESPTGNSFLQIWENTVDSADDPLCTVFEFVREQGYTDKFPEGQDWKVNIENNVIADGSYEQIGIRYEGMRPQHSLNPPRVEFNTIGAPDCASAAGARAIQFGDIPLNRFGEQIDGLLAYNAIDMDDGTCGTPGGVGVLVVGAPGVPLGDETKVIMEKNEVSGAFVGVRVDEHVVDIKLMGNTLLGDGQDGSGDIGVCTDAQSLTTKGKPNTIDGFDEDYRFGGCPTP